MLILKKTIVSVICLICILICVSGTASAAGGLSGSGTKKDPYRVSSASDLKKISSYLNKSGVCFLQTADISLSSENGWTPLGTESKPFKGVYDGGGHTVSALRIRSEEDLSGVGLFGHASGAEFRNIRLKDCSIEGKNMRHVGGVVGKAVNCSFEDCASGIDIVAVSPAGGLAGAVEYEDDAEPGKILRCTSSGSVTAEGEFGTGGLIGSVQAGYDCEENGDDYVYSTKGTRISGCASDATVRGTEDGIVNNIGGLIGTVSCVDVEDCRASGAVEGSGKNFGGLIGEFEGGVGSVSRCYATGNVTDNAGTGHGYGCAFVGGLIGWSRGARISDCYATGDVFSGGTWSDCQDDWMSQGGVWVRYRNPAGALIGCLHFSYSDTKFHLTRCYATGSVTAPNVCTEEKSYCYGSLVGYVYDDLMRRYVKDKSKKDQTDLSGFSDTTIGNMEHNYCLGTQRTYFTPCSSYARSNVGAYTGYSAVYVMPEIGYVKNITSGELSSRETFEGFDFENVWEMTEKGPALREEKNGTGSGGQQQGQDKSGDLNGDGRLTALDYMLLKRVVLRTHTPTEELRKACDMTGDGRVTATDYLLLKRMVLKTA